MDRAALIPAQGSAGKGLLGNRRTHRGDVAAPNPKFLPVSIKRFDDISREALRPAPALCATFTIEARRGKQHAHPATSQGADQEPRNKAPCSSAHCMLLLFYQISC